MRKARTALVSVASVALIATGGTMTASAASTTPASGKSEVGQAASAKASAAKAYSCTRGAFCFYTKQHGKGKRYRVFDNTNRNFKHINSGINNGSTSNKNDHVLFKYHYAHGNDHWGCLKPGKKWTYEKALVVDAVRWKSKC